MMMVVVEVVAFFRVQGFWEKVPPLIPRLGVLLLLIMVVFILKYVQLNLYVYDIECSFVAYKFTKKQY